MKLYVHKHCDGQSHQGSIDIMEDVASDVFNFLTDGNIFPITLWLTERGQVRAHVCNHSRYEDPRPDEFLYEVAEQGTLEVNRVVHKQIQMCALSPTDTQISACFSENNFCFTYLLLPQSYIKAKK